MAIIPLHILLLFISITVQSAESYNISKPRCPDNCGGIPIPFPFGIGDKCSLSFHFNVTCNTNTNGNPIPYLYGSRGIEIVSISILFGQARLKLPIYSYQCYNTTSNEDDYYTIGYGFDETPYMLNNERNIFMVIGCNTFASLTFSNGSSDYSVGCLSTCDGPAILEKYGPSCSGIGCCHTAIPMARNSFFLEFDKRYNHSQSQIYKFSRCSCAMFVADNFQFNVDYAITDKLKEQNVPVILDWIIENTTCKAAQKNKSSYACQSDHSVCIDYKNGPGYLCNCTDGYEGNPYLSGGCQDINECATRNPCLGKARCINHPGTYTCICRFGMRKNNNHVCELNTALVIGSCVAFATLSFLGFAIYIIMERRNLYIVKEKYFREYGGWILWEKIK